MSQNSPSQSTDAVQEALDRQRELLAGEIHDGFLQEVIGAKMLIEAAMRQIPGDGHDAKKQLGEAIETLTKAIEKTRQLIGDLQPTTPDCGIMVALEELAARQTDLQVQISGDPRLDVLPTAITAAVLRIVQEALANVRRHSQASEAAVQLIQENAQVVLKITDQGIGFDSGKIPPDRYGLKIIKQRARAVGGHAHFRSAPGQGTEIRVDLPL